jgi:hypothetical protein
MYPKRLTWMWWSFIAFSTTLLLGACGTGETGEAVEPSLDSSTELTLTVEDLVDMSAAPELENEVWLNVNSPLRISELRGKVVLLDFWTFG